MKRLFVGLLLLGSLNVLSSERCQIRVFDGIPMSEKHEKILNNILETKGYEIVDVASIDEKIDYELDIMTFKQKRFPEMLSVLIKNNTITSEQAGKYQENRFDADGVEAGVLKSTTSKRAIAIVSRLKSCDDWDDRG